MSIFFITGTSGSGKSTIMEYLKELLPESRFAVHDFDEVGVPDNADQAWRIATTLSLSNAYKNVVGVNN